MNYTTKFSRRANRVPSNHFAKILPLMSNPSNMVLAQGIPPVTTFPIKSYSFTLKQSEIKVNVNEQETQLAQRYPPFAWGNLISWLTSHMNNLHNPKNTNWSVAIAAGSMSSVDLAFTMFLDEEDTILVEEYSFTASLDNLKSRGVNIVGIKMDESGVIPDNLKLTCEQLKQKGIAPKALYIIPIGQNPTGTTLARDRYQQIYNICAHYNIIIIEDDPYYYEQHNSNIILKSKQKIENGHEIVPGLNLGETFLSYDINGIVFRLDSFSKFLAPGFRIGWVSGHNDLIQKYNELAYSSSQNGSSLSIITIWKMIESWENDGNGFEKHVKALQSTLQTRCCAIINALEENLSDLAEWTVPQAGMFVWLKLKSTNSMTFDFNQLTEKMEEYGVVVLPGDLFCINSDEETLRTEKKLRLTFVVDPQNYTEAIIRLRKCLLAISIPISTTTTTTP